MAGASDKARFYLEQYVPELQEYAQKQIFDRDEVSAIAAKRSDFEHILNARGSTPADYARYATYEMNLDSLRKKRCKRLGIRSTQYSGQRTILFVLERGTKKFPGDMGLWMQYIDYCKKRNANKKLAKAFTQVLRLLPREYGLWVLAAKHYAEAQGDMATARSYFQRGLRFCKDKRELWLEYAKLEMVYLAKLAARRKILGLDQDRTDKAVEEDEDMIALPTITAADFDPEISKGVEEVNLQALERLAAAPAYTGAIPVAIFDAAMKEFSNDTELAESFFILVTGFTEVPASKTIATHILSHLHSTAPSSPETIICSCRVHFDGIEVLSAAFPAALSEALSQITSSSHRVPTKKQQSLAEKVVLLLLPFLTDHERLDESIVTVLEATINKHLKVLIDCPPSSTSASRVLRPLAERRRNGELLQAADMLSILHPA